MKRLALLASLVAVALAAGCQRDEGHSPGKASRPAAGKAATAPGAADQNAVLARVGDVEITVGELEDQLNRQSPYVKARYTSLEQKREFLDSMIRFEILAAEAQRRGFDKDPEVVRTMKGVMVQKLMRAQFDDGLGGGAVTVSDAEVRAYYDANQAEYVRAEEVRASAIVVHDRAEAERIAALAHGADGSTNKGFRDLVDKYSLDDKTKQRGGDLRYFPRHADDDDIEMPPPPVVEAAFALPQTGAVSDAIDAGDGSFWVIKETGHRRSMTKSFEDVEPSIRTKLVRDKRLAAQDEYVARLRAQAKIEIVEDNLAKVRIEATPQDAADPHDVAPPPADPGTTPATPASAGAGSGSPTSP